MLTALNQCLPSDPEGQRPSDVAERNEIHITSLDCQWFPELSTWFGSGIGEKIKEAKSSMQVPQAGADQPPGAAPEPGDPDEAAMAEPGVAPPTAEPEIPEPDPNGPGWVIQLTGYHYHNKDRSLQTATFVRKTLIENLRSKKVTIADKDGNPSEIPIGELGITHPVIISPIKPPTADRIPNPDDPANPIAVSRWDFTIQFAWKPTPLSKRIELKQQQQPDAFAAQDGD
jgi:type IV pilus assembly protein PilM